MAHPKAEVIRRLLDSLAKRDVEGAATNLADDVVYHVSGHGPIAGVYKGRQEVMGLARKQMELTNGTFEITEIHDVVANDDHVVAMIRIRAQRHDRAFDWARVVVFHVENDRVTEAWIVEGDQAGLDRFLS